MEQGSLTQIVQRNARAWQSSLVGFVALLVSALFIFPLQAQSELNPANPHILRLTSKGCTHAPTVRRQTAFRVAGVTGLVTALHGVVDCTTISALSDDGSLVLPDLTLAAVDLEHDMALLWSATLATLPQAGLTPARLDHAAMLTAPLQIVGYPLGLEKQDRTTIARVRAIESLDDTIPDNEEPIAFVRRKSPLITIDVLNFQAQLLPGHAGAPLLDEHDQLVAVADGGRRGETVEQSWGILWDDVRLQDAAQPTIQAKLTRLADDDPAQALAFSSTYPAPASDTTGFTVYTVHVADRNYAAIADAEVTLAYPHGYEVAFTDSKGFALFKLNPTIDYTASTVLVEADGYQAVRRHATDPAQQSSIAEFRLERVVPTATTTPTPLPTATPTPFSTQMCQFAFIVLDASNDEPIRRAEVTVTLADLPDTGYTDSDGYYRSQLPCTQPQGSPLRLHIRAPGYEPLDRTLVHAIEAKEILLTASVTPTPTASPTPHIPPTMTPTARPTPCDTQSNPYAITPRQARQIGCPGQAFVPTRGVVVQQFEGGLMIVFDDPVNDDFQAPGKQRKSYVLANDGRAWRVYFDSDDVPQITSSNPDDWYSCEAAPGVDPAASGVPWRGFGLIWCTYPQIRQALGWVLENEVKTTASFQSYYLGRAFQLADQAEIYLVYLDADETTIDDQYLTGTWELHGGGGGVTPDATPRVSVTSTSSTLFQASVAIVCDDTKGQVWFAGTVTRKGQPVNGYRVLFKSAKVPGDEPATAPVITGPHPDHPVWAPGYYEHLVDAASWQAKPKSLQIWLTDGNGKKVSDDALWQTEGATGKCNKAVVDFVLR